MVLYLGYLFFQSINALLGLINIEFRDTFDSNFRESYDILFGYGSFQMFYMGFQALVDSANDALPCFFFLNVPIYPVLCDP